MRLNRFYVGKIEGRLLQHFGEQKMWLQDPALRHQWSKVLRLRVGDEVGLFNDEVEFIYEISDISELEYELIKKTEVQRRLPAHKVVLAWALLKSDKNDWVIQKATELGVSHLVPLVAERSEKIGFNEERASKIAIEAAEQCGRGDIPWLDEPKSIEQVVGEHRGSRMFFADMASDSDIQPKDMTTTVLVGPEGGWSDAERQFFADHGVSPINLGEHVLRAETAAIIAVSKLI